MNQLKIAVCGSNPPENEALVLDISQKIQDLLDVDPHIIGVSPIFSPNLSHDEYQLDSAYDRKLRFQELSGQAPEVVISAGCMIQEVAYQKSRVDMLGKKLNAALTIPNSPSQQQVEATMAVSVLQVLIQQAINELSQVWDFLYILPPLGELSSIPNLSEVNDNIEWFLNSLGGLDNKIPTFPLIKRVPEKGRGRERFIQTEGDVWTHFVEDQSAPLLSTSGLVIPHSSSTKNS